MTVRRLAAIVFIFACVTAAWTVLGTGIAARTTSGYDRLGDQVEELWGTAHLQRAPEIIFTTAGENSKKVELDAARILHGACDHDRRNHHTRRAHAGHGSRRLGQGAAHESE